jgi:hypothetical protein
MDITNQQFSRTNVTVEDTNSDHGGKRPEHVPEQQICVINDAASG